MAVDSDRMGSQRFYRERKSVMSEKNPAVWLLKWLMVIIIALMAILVFLNVVLRYGFNSNLMVTEELGRYLFVWLTFLGAISAFIRNRHVRVDTFFIRMSPPTQRVVSIISDLAVLACCALIVLGCWKLTMLNTTNYLMISELPVATLYFAGVPTGLVIGLLLLVRIWRSLSGKGVAQ